MTLEPMLATQGYPLVAGIPSVHFGWHVDAVDILELRLVGDTGSLTRGDVAAVEGPQIVAP